VSDFFDIVRPSDIKEDKPTIVIASLMDKISTLQIEVASLRAIDKLSRAEVVYLRRMILNNKGNENEDR